MAEDYSIELALLLALVREPDEIETNGQITWGMAPDRKSYDILPPIMGCWQYAKATDDSFRDTTFHQLFRWFSNPAYRKRYGLDSK